MKLRDIFKDGYMVNISGIIRFFMKLFKKKTKKPDRVIFVDNVPAPDTIITMPNIQLYRVCRKTSLEEVEKLCLVDRIKSALPNAWTEGFGLAAIQIGIPIRAGWFKTPKGEELLLINPEIYLWRYPFVVPGEGCLSIPNQWFNTNRFQKILVKNNGEILWLTQYAALIAQHEIDHMDGRLVTSRVHIEKNIDRNNPCPDCLREGKTIKWKKCKIHNTGGIVKEENGK